MAGLSSMRLFLGLLLAACAGHAQHRATLSGGWSRQVGGFNFRKPTAAGLGLSYGYRVHPHIEVETGLFTALGPGGDFCTRFGCFDPHDRFFWVPLGVRFIAPMAWKRVEVSGGGGGLWEKYSVDNPNEGFSLRSRQGWGGYFVAGAAVFLDQRRHFWLGASPRLFLANPRFGRDRWFQILGEFSVRF